MYLCKDVSLHMYISIFLDTSQDSFTNTLDQHRNYYFYFVINNIVSRDFPLGNNRTI